ncbi:MAG: hypothetical protein ACRD9R_21220 [Pyrinomonadaceae bacterium]
MCKRYLSVTLVALVICSMGGRAALAATPTKTEVERNKQIQTVVSKLVRDAKAERNTLLLNVPQAPRGKGNNLSTRAKVAIGVSIVAAVVLIIFVAKSPILNDGR